ncbi:MAG TPA: amino acid permease [Fimbriiglobus sp.]|jgi:amino acid transporter
MDKPAPSSLPRVLGPWLATAIVVGCVIGTGVFKKGTAVSKAVPESGLGIAAWIVVGLLTWCGAMALAEVASLFPLAGGNYVFLREAYGRLFGFLWGWVEFWFLRVASCAALSSVFVESLNDVLKLALHQDAEVIGFWPRQAIASASVLVLGLLSAHGTKLGAGFQFAVTTIKVGSIVALILLPVVILGFALDSPVKPDWDRFKPVWPTNWTDPKLAIGFAAAMVAILWPYNGWSNMAAIAGEIRNPQRNIPLAYGAGLVLLITLYSLVNVSYYLAIPASEMAKLTDTPVAAEVCRRLVGPVGLLIGSAAIMISVFGAIGGNMLVGPRSLFALARDGLAPSTLGGIHTRYQTPYAATLLLTFVTVGFIFAVSVYSRLFPSTKSYFDTVTDFVVFGAGILETMAVAAIFVFRTKHKEEIAKLPYRCPGYPLIPAVYVAVMTAVLGQMLFTKDSRTEALIGLGFIAAGAGVFGLLTTRKRQPISPSL